MNAYMLHGATLTSDRRHPLLRPLEGADVASEAGVTLRSGAIPRPDGAPLWQSPFACVARDGGVRLSLPGVADVLIDSDGSVTIDAVAGAADTLTDLLIAGPVSAVLALQRDALPMRGACVAIGGRAVMIAGPPARGASSLAAALIARGATLVSDGTCIVAHDAARGPVMLPGLPWIAIERDAQVLLSEAVWRPVRPGAGRGGALVRSSGAAVPLTAIVRPAAVRGGGPALARMGGADALAPIADLVPLYAIAQASGRGGAVFAQAMRVAGAVPVLSLDRPDFARLDAAAEAIEDAVT